MANASTPPSSGEESVKKAVGSTWIWRYEGKLWPVVLCDDAVPPAEFMVSRSDVHALPAILLGKHKFIWVRQKGLQEFDPSNDYSGGLWEEKQGRWQARDESDRTEKFRCDAFHQDAMQFRDDGFWGNYLKSEHEIRRLQREIRQPNGKRKKRDCEDDDDPDSSRETAQPARLPTPSQTPKKQQRANFQEMFARFENDGAFSGKEIIDAGADLDPNDPFQVTTSKSRSPENDQQRIDDTRARNMQEVIDKRPPYTEVTVIIGDEHTPFFLKKDDVSKIQHLTELVQFDEDLRAHVKLFEEDGSISVDDFKQIVEFLRTGDFAPKFTDKDESRLEGGSMPDLHRTIVAKIATVYLTATKLRFVAMQRLAVRKLKSLSPLDVAALLSAVVYSNRATELDGSSQELKRWLVDQMAEQFFGIYAENSVSMTRIMEDNSDLREDIIKKLPVYQDARKRTMT